MMHKRMRRRFHQMPHHRTSKRGKRFKAGKGSKKTKVRLFRRPSKSTMSRHKNMSYNQIMGVYPISPFGDDDGDKKRNWEDCRPWDKERQDVDGDEERQDVDGDEDETEDIFPSTQILTFRKGEGIPIDVEDGDIVKIELNEGYVEGTVVGTGKYETHKLVRVDKGTPIEK